MDLFKKSSLSLSILFSILFSSYLTAAPMTGKALRENCQAALDIFDKNSGRVQTESDYLQGMKAGTCYGYIKGIIDTDSHLFCVPTIENKLKAIAIVTTFMDDHTKELSNPAPPFVIHAYEGYFHCHPR